MTYSLRIGAKTKIRAKCVVVLRSCATNDADATRDEIVTLGDAWSF